MINARFRNSATFSLKDYLFLFYYGSATFFQHDDAENLHNHFQEKIFLVSAIVA